ncbi:MAG TPA: DoxX family protein [Chitinophagaceae bacterium]|nr:DoxX family protein [Chitinophagaceae bacterium]
MKNQQTPSKALHIALWIAQVLLAAMFLMAGFMKLSQPIEQLSQMLPWAAQVPESLVRFIGLAELLGAVGLILPALLRIKPQLTAWAAIGIAIIMVLATFFHISRGETSAIGMNIIMAILAAFIAWGRFKKAPIRAKA